MTGQPGHHGGGGTGQVTAQIVAGPGAYDHLDPGRRLRYPERIAVTVDDMRETLARLKEQGIEPEREPYRIREGGSLLCFVRDPDGYRLELIEKPGA